MTPYCLIGSTQAFELLADAFDMQPASTLSAVFLAVKTAGYGIKKAD
jgi:hypothetical protein